MSKFYQKFPKDLTGIRFGRLVVLSKHDKTDKNISGTLWLCKCDCSKVSIKKRLGLVIGTTKSCGCLGIERLLENSTKHGQSRTPENVAWRSMKQRCLNKKCRVYKYYGGRGIKVCKAWLKFENFYSDVGKRPSNHHSLERINNKGDYTPENTRWATRLEQANNKRMNRIIIYKKNKFTIAQAAREFNIDHELLRSRLKRGWSVKEAIEKPIIKPTKRCSK